MLGERKGVNLGSLEAVERVNVLMLENPEVVLGEEDWTVEKCRGNDFRYKISV